MVPVSGGVADLLLCDARLALRREVATAANRHDLTEVFAAWVLSGCEAVVGMTAAVAAAERAAGAARTYRDVAILGFAAHGGTLGPTATAVLGEGLRWLVKREPVVAQTPMPFCTDPVGLFGVAVGAAAFGDQELTAATAAWLARCLAARADPNGAEDWTDLLDAVGLASVGRPVDVTTLADRPEWSDIRVALRARGFGPLLGNRPADTDEYDALVLTVRGVGNMGLPRAAIRLAALDYIRSKAVPGSLSEARYAMAKRQADQGVDPRKVFVVHGRNNTAREALFAFLRAVGLHPLEWSEIVTATGKAAPYIGEVLEKGFSIAQAVVVLMTPDDEARLREPYRGSHEPAHETDLTPQPRPNVLLEAGMALGLFPDRTVIVELGQLRPVSDIGGRHVVRMNDTPEKRHELAQRLETAGCAVNRTGTDWYKAGSFANPL
jgi:predicted nucleotide-binding protein